MIAQTPIDQLHAVLSDFVNGTSSARWTIVSQQLQKPMPRGGDSVVPPPELLEACWQLLSEENFAVRVESYYTPAPGIGHKAVADRLVRNARALFATACVATVAPHATTSTEVESLSNWFARAVAALDDSHAGSSSLAVVDVKALLRPDGLNATAAEPGEPVPAVACALVWSRWWLTQQTSADGDARRTWIAWVSPKTQGAGSVKVSDAGLPYPHLIEHPRVALMPAKDDWLAAIKRAWELSRGATCGRTITWEVNLPGSSSMILGGRSAGCAFYVALACLLDRRACDPSRAILAALADDETKPMEIGDLDEKIKALRGSISCFGVADTQQYSLLHPDTRIERCGSLAEALEFMSGVATKLRSFASTLAKIAARSDDLYIEPMLVKTTSLITQFSSDGDATDAQSTADKIGKPAWTALQPLLGGATKRVIIVAGSGFGKTLLAEWTVRRLAKASLDFFEQHDDAFEGKRHLFALPLTAGDLLAALVEAEARQVSRNIPEFDNQTAFDLVLRAGVVRYPQHEPAIRFLLDCASGRRNDFDVLIVVDGLDDVRVERRRIVARLLRHLSTWPSRMLVTGREYAFDPIDIEDSLVYRLREFSPPQMRRYVEAMLGSEQARVVLHLFNSHPATRLFGHVPLLLAMVCRGLKRVEREAQNVIEEATQKIETDYPTRTALYRELFLDRLGQELAPSLADQRLAVLSRVGNYWLKTTTPNGEVSERTIIDWIGTDTISAIPIGEDLRTIYDRNVNAAVIASTLLDDFVRVGILAPTLDRKAYRATHPTFIEYLAGRHMATRIDKGEQAALDELMDHALNPSWRAVTPFVAGELKNLLPIAAKLDVSSDPFHLHLFTNAKWLAEAEPSARLEPEVTKVANQLVALLKSESPIDRYHAVEAIGEIGSSWRRILTPLVSSLLNEQKFSVRIAALEAACLLDAPGAVEQTARHVRENTAKGRERLLRRLAAADQQAAVRVAKELLSVPVLNLGAAAIDVLLSAGDAEIDSLVAQLRSDNNFSRELASRALAASGNAAVAEKLRPLLIDEANHVRAIAVQTLASFDVEWRLETLRQMAGDTSTQVRIAVAAALSVIGTHEALTLVSSLLYDKEERVVLRALDAISRAHFLSRADAEALLNCDDRLIRLRAAAVYHRLGDDDYVPRLHAAVQENGYEQIALEQLAFVKDPRSVSFLLGLLSQSAPPIQAMIAHTLGKLGDPRAVPALMELLDSRDSNTRINVAEALGQIRHFSASTALIDRLTDSSDRVRRAVIKALGHIGDVRAIVPLLEVLQMAEQDEEISELMTAIASFATVADLLAALKKAGGVLRVAQSCPPGVIYALLFPLVWSAPTEVWREQAPDLAELTVAAAKPHLANTQPSRRHA
jgi:HEAT repeat protein